MSTQATPRQLAPRHGTCRLTLHINGTAYRVKPLPADVEAVYMPYELSAGGKRHHVAMTPEGHDCTCPDYVFHRDGLDPEGCKHVKAMKAVGLIDDV